VCSLLYSKKDGTKKGKRVNEILRTGTVLSLIQEIQKGMQKRQQERWKLE
jgi:hypothetical protein